MSTVAAPKIDLGKSPPNDPHYYGYRDEPVLQPDGTYKFERIALTLEDHLHPHEGDHFVEDNLHHLLGVYLFDVFRSRVQDNPTALVLANTGIYWDDPELGHHAPDIAVIFGIRRQRPRWPSFDVAEEGTRPKLITELVSPRYRDNDVKTKMVEYHQAQVPIYVILDQEEESSPFVIRAYQHRPRGYVPLPFDEDGRLWLSDLNLFLGVRDFGIVCFDGTTDLEIGDYSAISKNAEKLKSSLNSEKARAEAEKLRADAAEAKLREMNAELARLKIQPPPT